MQKYFSNAITSILLLALLQELVVPIQSLRVRVVRVRKDKRQAFTDNNYNNYNNNNNNYNNNNNFNNNFNGGSNNYPTVDSYTEVDNYRGAEANPFNVGSKPQDYPDRRGPDKAQGPGAGQQGQQERDRYGPPGAGGDFGGPGTGGGGAGQAGPGTVGGGGAGGTGITGPGIGGGPATGPGTGGAGAGQQGPGTGGLGGGGQRVTGGPQTGGIGGGGSRGPGQAGGGSRGPGAGAVGAGKQKTTIEPSRIGRQPDGTEKKKVAGTDDEDCETCVAGIPGEPGVDYPIYNTAPKTSFACKAQKWPGYYADKEAKCQAFFICDQDRMSVFLCPNGTIFNQQVFVCDWWFNVDCGTSDSYYSRNQYLFQSGIGIDGQPIGSSRKTSGSRPIPAILNSRPSFVSESSNNNGQRLGGLGSGVASSSFGERTYSQRPPSLLDEDDEVLGARLNRNDNYNNNKNNYNSNYDDADDSYNNHGGFSASLGTAETMISRTIAPMHSMSSSEYNKLSKAHPNPKGNSNMMSAPSKRPQYPSSNELNAANHEIHKIKSSSNQMTYSTSTQRSTGDTLVRAMGHAMSKDQGTMLQKALAQFTSSSPVHYINNVKANGAFQGAQGARVNQRADVPSASHVKPQQQRQQQQQQPKLVQQHHNNKGKNGGGLGAKISQFSNHAQRPQSSQNQKQHPQQHQQRKANNNHQQHQQQKGNRASSSNHHQQQGKSHQKGHNLQTRMQQHPQQGQQQQNYMKNGHNNNNKHQQQRQQQQHHNNKGNTGFSSNQVSSSSSKPSINAAVHNGAFGSKTNRQQQSKQQQHNNANNNRNQQQSSNYRNSQEMAHQIKARENMNSYNPLQAPSAPKPAQSSKPSTYYMPPRPTSAQESTHTFVNHPPSAFHSQNTQISNSRSDNYDSREFPIDVPLLMPRGSAPKSILNPDYLPDNSNTNNRNSKRDYESQIQTAGSQTDYADAEPSAELDNEVLDMMVVDKLPPLPQMHTDSFASSSGISFARTLPSPAVGFLPAASQKAINVDFSQLSSEVTSQIPSSIGARYSDFTKTIKRGLDNSLRQPERLDNALRQPERLNNALERPSQFIKQQQQQSELLNLQPELPEAFEKGGTSPSSNLIQDYTEYEESTSDSSDSENHTGPPDDPEEFPTTVRYAKTSSERDSQRQAGSFRSEKALPLDSAKIQLVQEATSPRAPTTLNTLTAESSTFGQKIKPKGVRKSSYSNWSNYFYLRPDNK